MGPTLADGLRALAQAGKRAKLIRVEVDAGYLRRIEEVEALPENQPGADKSWVGQLMTGAARHFARAAREG